MFRQLTTSLIAAVTLLSLVTLVPPVAIAQAPPVEELRIRHLFVPEAQLGAALMRDQHGVVVSAKDFAELVRKAQEQRTNQRRLQGELTIRQAAYDARVEGERLTATLRMNLDNATGSWGTASFHIGDWRVESAVLVNAAAAESTPLLVRSGESQQSMQIFVPEPGPQSLVLELSLPLTAIGSDKAAQVQMTGTSVSEFSITLPPGKHLLLSGAELPRPSLIDQAATYRLPAGGISELALQITDRQQTERADVLTFASTLYGVTVSPGQINWSANTTLQVYGQPVDQLACTIPNDLEITSVDSEGLEGWSLTTDPAAPDRTTITLQYRQPFDGVRAVVFHGVLTARGESAWTVPNLILNRVTSHVGALVVSHPSGIRLQAVEAQGVRAVTDLAVPEGLVAPGNQLRFQIWNEAFALRFATAAKQQEVRAALTNILDVNQHWLDLYTTVDLEARFAPLFEARLRLPTGWMVVQVTEGNSPVTGWSVVPVEGGQEVRLELASPLNPGESRQITMTSMLQPEQWPIEDLAQTLSLPEVILPQAGMVEALFGVVADDSFAVVPVDLVSLDAARQDDVNALNQRLVAIGKEIRLGYGYQDSTFSGQLEVSRKPATLVASTTTFARLDPETLFAYLEGRVSVTGGGLRELQISVAEAAGRDLRFQVLPETMDGNAPSLPAARIVEQEASEPMDGRILWRLKLDRFLVGSLLIQSVVQIPRDPAAAAIDIPNWQFIAAEQQNGFIAVEAANDQRVQVSAQTAAGTPLATVDPIDFPKARYVPVNRVVAGYQHVRPDWQVSINAERFERDPLPTAIGQSLNLITVVSEAGKIQNEATLKFQAVGVQSLLLKLPESSGSRLWATLLDGQPVEVRQTEQGYQIPLLAGQTAAQRIVRITYQSQARPLEQIGDWYATPPTFSVLAGAGSEQPLEILEQQWDLKTPQSVALFSSNGQFEPTSRLDRSTLFGALTDLLVMPGSTRLTAIGVALVMLIITLVVLRVLIRRLGGFGTIIVVMLFGLIATFVTLPALQIARRSSPESGDIAATTAAPMAATFENYNDMKWESPAEPMPQVELAVPLAEDMELSSQVDEFQRFEKLDQSLPGGFGGGTGLGGGGGFDGAGGAIDGTPASAFPVTPASPETPLSSAAMPQQQEFAIDNRMQLGRETSFAGMAQGGALLSLTVPLEEPSDARTHRFTYRGNGVEGLHLRIKYANLQAAQFLLMSLGAGVLLCGWWLRAASWMVRSLWLLIAIALPWALGPILPAALQMVAEAIVCGGALSALLWCLYGIIQWLPKCCSGTCCLWLLPVWARRKTACVLLFAGLTLTGAVTAEEPSPKLPTEPYVIIPYAAETEPLQAERVFIPHQLYQELWSAAHPEATLQGPQVAPQVVEANYAAKLASEGGLTHLQVQSRLVAVVSEAALNENSKARLILPFQGVSIGSALLNGEPATLETDAQSQALFVLMKTAGTHVLDITFDLPVSLEGQSGMFRINLLPTPAARFELTLPNESPDAQVNHSTVTYRKLEVDGQTRLIAPVGHGGTYEFTWRPRKANATVTGSLQLETAIAVLIEDAGLSVNQSFVITPRQQVINELSFQVSPGAVVRRISGGDVGGWELGEADGATMLKVFLRRPVDTQTRVDIDLYQGLALTDADVAIQVPVVDPAGVASEAGLLGIYAGEQFSVRGTPGDRVTQINNDAFAPTAMPNGVSGSPVLAYRFVMRPCAPTLVISRRPPVAITTADHGVTMEHRRLLVASQLNFNLTGAPRPAVNIELPPEYLPIDVAAEGLTDWYVSDLAGRRILTVELEQPKLGQLSVFLEGRLPRPPGNEVHVILPAPVDVSKLTTTLAVWLDASEIAAVTSNGNWRSIDPSAMSGDLRQLVTANPQFAFRSSGLILDPISLTTSRVTPELQADGVTLIAATPATLEYGFTFRWKISRAAADTFQFTTPGWLADRLDINAPGMRQILSTPLADGRTLWTVTLVEPVRETYLLTAAATLPVPEDQRIEAPVVQFQSGAVDALTPLEFQRQYAILVNLSAAQIVPVDMTQIESVPRDELPLNVSAELVQQAMEIARVRVDRVPVWRSEQIVTQQAASASVTVADLATVVESDGSWRTRATYTVRNRGRQFLALRLPEAARLLSVIVRGEQSRAVTSLINQQTAHLIALPQTSEADLSFEIKLILTGQLDQTLPQGIAVRGVALEIPVPQVIGVKESTEYGLTVAQTLWNVHLPEEYLALPLQDVTRSNLTWHQNRDATLNAELKQLESLRADMVFMCASSLDTSNTASTRAQSASNLRQLATALEDFRRSYGSRSNSEAVQVIQKKEQEVFEELQKSLRDVERAVIVGNEFDEQGSAVAPLREGGQQGARGFIETNNNTNFFINGGAELAEQQAARPEFRFSRGSEMSEVQQGKGAKSRAGLKGQLQMQGAIAGNSLNADYGTVSPNTPIQFYDGVMFGQNFTMPQRQSGVDDFSAENLYAGTTMRADQPVDATTWWSLNGIDNQPQIANAWSATGGLSLDLDIPLHGQVYSFSKIGGEPRLTFQVQPRDFMHHIRGGLWLLVWGVTGFWVCHWLARLTTLRMALRVLSVVAIIAGLTGALLLPTESASLSFMGVIVGGLLLAVLPSNASSNPTSS